VLLAAIVWMVVALSTGRRRPAGAVVLGLIGIEFVGMLSIMEAESNSDHTFHATAAIDLVGVSFGLLALAFVLAGPYETWRRAARAPRTTVQP